jgi:hypothetical protein
MNPTPPRAGASERPSRAADAQAAVPSETPLESTRTAPTSQNWSVDETFQALERLREVVERVRAERPEVAAFLEHAAVVEEQPGILTLAYEPGSVFAKELEAPTLQRLIGEAASAVFSRDTRIEFLFDHPSAKGMDTLSADRVRAREERVRKARSKARSHPRVNEAIEVFAAKIKDLRVNER